MTRFYVDMPMMDFSAGIRSGHEVVEAVSVEAALERTRAWEAFPETAPNTAVPLPPDVLGLSRDEILDLYAKIHEELGDERFYREVMGVRNPRSIPRAPASFYIDGREVTEDEFNRFNEQNWTNMRRR